jgi:hypothetical protein
MKVQTSQPEFLRLLQNVSAKPLKSTSLPAITEIGDDRLVIVTDSNTGNKTVYMSSGGVLILLATTAGNVASIFGRTGVVTAQSGDYTAAQITQSSSYRFVTDAEITAWNAATVLRSQSGVVAVTSGVQKTITFPVVFSSTPTAICMFCGADGSSSVINSDHLTVTTIHIIIPAADIIQDGNIYWNAGI